FLTNSYESITQATPLPSSLVPLGSVRTTRPLHWITTSSLPPVTSGGKVISNSTGEPTSSEASARMYTPAALRLPVMPLVSPAVSSLCILIGNCSGNLFPVRASDTTPPLLSLCASIQRQKTKPENHGIPSPKPDEQLSALYHGKYRKRSPDYRSNTSRN